MKQLFIFFICLTLCFALPVKENKDDTKHENEVGSDWEANLEYGRYLKEVVQALESDPEFRKKLESANVDDIKNGKISKELHLVDHKVRTRLDELKRNELERLRKVAMKEYEKAHNVDRKKLKIPVHVDHKSPDRFHEEDLRKLIKQLSEDLSKYDDQRKTDFKEHEIEKEYAYQHSLDGLNEEDKRQAVGKHEDMIKKHKDHPKLREPGHKEQLQEVWEGQDHMKGEAFDADTFFYTHDLDGNGVWDEMEVKMLFKAELDKMYDPNASEDDLQERYEEMERMREHVFTEADVNRDHLITYEEFLDQTKKSDFGVDDGWQGVDEQQEFTPEEYAEFERERQEEMAKLIQSGQVPDPTAQHAQQQQPQQVPQQVPQQYQQQQQVPQQYQQPQQQVPQQYQQPPQQYQQPQQFQQQPQPPQQPNGLNPPQIKPLSNNHV